MNKFLLISALSVPGMATVVSCSSGQEQSIQNMKTETVQVYGNCEMCKERIESAANGLSNVQTAIWDVESKLLTVSYDSSRTSSEKIEEAIALSGHDTKNVKATGEVYQNLPGCCQYTRK